MTRSLVILGILALFVSCAFAEQDQTIMASKIIGDINNKSLKTVTYHDSVIKGPWDFSILKSREINKPIEITYSIIEEALDLGPEDTTFLGKVDFSGTRFKKSVIFSKSNFSNGAEFQRTQFDEAAEFRHSQFSGTTNFAEAQFSKYGLFDESYFAEFPTFDSSHFFGLASFNNTTFSKIASFNKVQFDSIANFCYSIFHDKAYFQEDRFSTKAYFDHVNFTGRVDFYNSQFNDYASFQNVIIRDNISLKSAKIATIEFKDILSNKTSKIDLTNSTFSRFLAQWNKGENISKLIPENGNQGTVYIALIKNYQNLQWLEDANDCYYAFREWDRHHSNSFNFLFDNLDYLFNGYGIRPVVPIEWSIIFILAFAVIFSLKQTFREKRNAPCPYIPHPDEVKSSQEKSSLESVVRRFPLALLFSSSAFIPKFSYFTDVFINLEPAGTLGKVAFQAERIIGAIFISLIIVAIVRVYVTGYVI